MKKWSVRMLVEASIMIALAIVLDQIKLYKLPNGGSVTAGSMVPILLFAMRHGVKPGITAGIVFGILQILLGGYVITPIQGLLDYPLAFGLLGLAGLYTKNYKDNNDNYIKMGLFIFIAVIGRMISHFLSGVVFFGEFATGNVFIYSFLYQLSYLIPEYIISFIIISLIWKPLRKAGV